MIAPNAKTIQSAISRLPQQASSAVTQVLANARRAKLAPLIEACEAELKLRGSLTMSAPDAARAAEVSVRVAGLPADEVIATAFREIPPKPEESVILRWIGEHPGTSYKELAAVYPKGDLSLVIGHLVYHRFGYFRGLLAGGAQSDLLLDRDSTGKSIRYTLRPDAATAFASIGLLPEPAGATPLS